MDGQTFNFKLEAFSILQTIKANSQFEYSKRSTINGQSIVHYRKGRRTCNSSNQPTTWLKRINHERNFDGFFVAIMQIWNFPKGPRSIQSERWNRERIHLGDDLYRCWKLWWNVWSTPLTSCVQNLKQKLKDTYFILMLKFTTSGVPGEYGR